MINIIESNSINNNSKKKFIYITKKDKSRTTATPTTITISHSWVDCWVSQYCTTTTTVDRNIQLFTYSWPTFTCDQYMQLL